MGVSHIFLTGALQAGKSTIISKVAASCGKRIGGFCTSFGAGHAARDIRACVPPAGRRLYLYPACGSPLFDEAHVVARFTENGPYVIPGRFEKLGVPLLRKARTNAELIIMDECGRMESDAAAFQSEILSALDGDIPVLGVVREDLPGWTPVIAAHPNVRLITVTPQNRDALTARLLRQF